MNIDVQKIVGELVEARVLCNSAMKQINEIADGIIQGINAEQEEIKKKEPAEPTPMDNEPKTV